MGDLQLTLSAQDQRYLAELEKKYELVRDRVRGVVAGRHTGFFLGGRGGIGKSRTIADELDRLGVPFILTNSHLTGRGLVDLLENYPDSIHLIDDIEEAVRDPQAMSVLKSALWGTRRNREGRLERWITWNAHGVVIEFPFTGGILMTSNLDLRNLPRLAALKTRISWLDLRVSNPEVEALMRKIALEGYPPGHNRLESRQCIEVVQFIIVEAARVNRSLDLRLLVNSFEDRLQAEDYEAGLSWRDLVASRLCERPSIIEEVAPYETRSQKKSRQLAIAREIVGLEPEERLRVWQDRTNGASRATLYRRLDELARADALVFET